jgi:hypothetical protein
MKTVRITTLLMVVGLAISPCNSCNNEIDVEGLQLHTLETHCFCNGFGDSDLFVCLCPTLDDDKLDTELNFYLDNQGTTDLMLPCPDSDEFISRGWLKLIHQSSEKELTYLKKFDRVDFNNRKLKLCILKSEAKWEFPVTVNSKYWRLPKRHDYDLYFQFELGASVEQKNMWTGKLKTISIKDALEKMHNNRLHEDTLPVGSAAE